MLNLVAKKIGMSRIYKENGSVQPFTMVKIYDNCVIDLKVDENKDFGNLLIGFDKSNNAKKVSKSVAGVFNKKKLPVHKKIYGCKVRKNTDIKIGDVITADSILKEGDIVSVSGISIGKGFAGGMKRHGFGGLEATHGISISHRSHGSTGQCQDPGKVFKGKKMAGHMGVDKVTVKNLSILLIDRENNTVGIKGSIPGSNGSDVFIKIDRNNKIITQKEEIKDNPDNNNVKQDETVKKEEITKQKKEVIKEKETVKKEVEEKKLTENKEENK